MSPDFHLLQVCNVGQIAGGTAACAWSLTRAFPHWRHSVAFLSTATPETVSAFHPHQVISWTAGDRRLISRIAPDMVVMHNLSEGRIDAWPDAFSIQYIHSQGRRMKADLTVYCSHWLARQSSATSDSVLWQGVPRPFRRESSKDTLPGVNRFCRQNGPSIKTEARAPESTHERPVRIGRICTPTVRKWPDSLIPFYAQLSMVHPRIHWDFVGCPDSMQQALQSACGGRTRFHPASWEARSLLWEWDAMLYHHPDLTESFGRTVAEAARAGCIPIVDDRGGFTEQLRVLGVEGCRTVEDFSHAIHQLSDPEWRVHTTKTIREHADRHFSLSAFGSRVREILNRSLN